MKASAEKVVWTWRSPNRICFAAPPGTGPRAVAARASSDADDDPGAGPERQYLAAAFR